MFIVCEVKSRLKEWENKDGKKFYPITCKDIKDKGLNKDKIFNLSEPLDKDVKYVVFELYYYNKVCGLHNPKPYTPEH